MRPTEKERRPQAADLKAAESFGGDSTIIPPEADIVVDGAPARVVFDHRFLAGYEAGYVHGIERGRQLADDEAQWPMRLAEQHARRLADIEPFEARWQRTVGA